MKKNNTDVLANDFEHFANIQETNLNAIVGGVPFDAATKYTLDELTSKTTCFEGPDGIICTHDDADQR